jgi:hypothetical protein
MKNRFINMQDRDTLLHRSSAIYLHQRIVLKTRLKVEESELATNCSQLKMQSVDGKFYKTETISTVSMLIPKRQLHSKNYTSHKLPIL